ncbi:hypothetical protein Leryth_026696 [Lithospermum erythrorhizon]|nr:hypothetical protein Leryth_026696 [Lithospermum erythrorhizon]
MVHHCCTKQKVRRGLWSPEEDDKLVKCIQTHGLACWSSVPKLSGLQRCGKSCRLRWINYLRPDLKKGSFTEEEERTIIDVHRILGNKWAQIAKHLQRRTDNEVKNFWNSCIKKKLIAQGLDPETHNLLSPNKNKLKSSNNIAIKNKKFYPEDIHEVFTIETSRTSMNFASIVEMKESPPTHFQEFVPLSQFEHNQENHPNPPMLIDELQHCSMTEMENTILDPIPISKFGYMDDDFFVRTSHFGTIPEVPVKQQQVQTIESTHEQQQIMYRVQGTGGFQETGTTYLEDSNFNLDFVESSLDFPPGIF